jgi:tetratricopeptide (TPR) repeat protein
MQNTFFARINIPGYKEDEFEALMGFSGHTRASDKDIENTTELLKRAHESYFRGFYMDGIRQYAQVLRVDAKRITAWLGQVRILVDTGYYDSAIYCADKGAASLEDKKLLYFAQAYALACAGRIDEARAIINIRVEKNETPMSWLLRGEVLLRMKIGFIEKLLKPYKDVGRLGAFFCFLKALSADQRDPFINQRIGLAYLQAKNYRRAFAYLKTSLNSAGDNPLTLYGLAECYRLSRDDEHAIYYAKKAIAGNPYLDCAFTLLQQLHSPRARFFKRFRAARKELS